MKQVFQGPHIEKEAPRGFNARGTWQGPVVVFPWIHGIFRIDCARRAVGFEWDAKVATEFDRIQSENLLMTARMRRASWSSRLDRWT